jgi:hypothetical protein
MKSRLVAAAAVLAIIAQAPAFATPRVNQAGTELATPKKPSRATIKCNSASSCSVLIAKCVERGGKWTPEGFNPQGQPIKGKCTGL